MRDTPPPDVVAKFLWKVHWKAFTTPRAAAPMAPPKPAKLRAKWTLRAVRTEPSSTSMAPPPEVWRRRRGGERGDRAGETEVVKEEQGFSGLYMNCSAQVGKLDFPGHQGRSAIHHGGLEGEEERGDRAGETEAGQELALGGLNSCSSTEMSKVDVAGSEDRAIIHSQADQHQRQQPPVQLLVHTLWRGEGKRGTWETDEGFCCCCCCCLKRPV